MGYGDAQVRELEEIINSIPADVVVEGTPIDLRRMIEVEKPIANVGYELQEIEPGQLEAAVARALAEAT
jgi:predicted GTPase